MQFTYLGTTRLPKAGPAVFLPLQILSGSAARLGGKNIRTRSQAIVNDDLFNRPAAGHLPHKLAHGLDLSRVRYLLLTHRHTDHFYPQELTVRGSCYNLDMVSPVLDIYCAAGDLRFLQAVHRLGDRPRKPRPPALPYFEGLRTRAGRPVHDHTAAGHTYVA